MGTQLLQSCRCRKAVFRAELFWFAVFDELVGPADAHNRLLNGKVVEFFKDRAAKAAHEHVIFQRENHIYIPGEKFQGLRVQGLAEARVDDRRA